MPLPKLTKGPSLKALGINPGKFKSEIKLQAATIVASMETHIETSMTMGKIFRDAEKHLDRAVSVLNMETVAHRLATESGLPQVDATKLHRVHVGTGLYGTKECGAKAKRAQRAVSKYRRQLENELGMPPRQTKSTLACQIAAARLHRKILECQKSPIGYWGANCLFWLGYDRQKPANSSKADPAVNRFWTACKRGAEHIQVHDVMPFRR